MARQQWTAYYLNGTRLIPIGKGSSNEDGSITIELVERPKHNRIYIRKNVRRTSLNPPENSTE